MSKLLSKIFARKPLVAFAFILAFSSITAAQTVRWATAIRDTLRLELAVSGEIEAVNSTVVTTPIIWDFDLLIIDMIPEGAQVDSGAALVRLDPTIPLNKLEQVQTQLQSLQAELQGMRAEHEGKANEMKRDVEMKANSLQLAQIDLQQLRYASISRKRQGELEVLQAEVILHEAEKMLGTEQVIQRTVETEQRLKIFQTQSAAESLQRQLEQMTLRAPIAGMVLYHLDENGEKPQIGEKIKLGKGTIDLPDLSRLQVKVTVNELDVAKLTLGQKAFVRLEAFPRKRFHARLISLGKVATPLEQNSQVRVFEAVLEIAETDSVLKPGMTAKVNILFGEIPDAIFVPIGCVFETNGEPVVFTDKSGDMPISVKVGARNNYYISVEGIEAGTQVAWQPAAHGAKPLGYADFRKRKRRPMDEYDSFFNEMEKRHLTFDYKAVRKHSSQPANGVAGDKQAVHR